MNQNFADIIQAAAGSVLGVICLLLIILGLLGYQFFAKSSESLKLAVFAMLMVGGAGFAVAIAMSGNSADAVRGPELTPDPDPIPDPIPPEPSKRPPALIMGRSISAKLAIRRVGSVVELATLQKDAELEHPDKNTAWKLTYTHSREGQFTVEDYTGGETTIRPENFSNESWTLLDPYSESIPLVGTRFGKRYFIQWLTPETDK